MRITLMCVSILAFFSSTAQKLRRADRKIVSNLQMHSSQLKTQTAGGNTGGAAAKYIADQLQRAGVKPGAGNSEWIQKYDVFRGRRIGNGTSLEINGEKLVPGQDYFPLPFSANKSAEGSVAIALAEDGYPWFRDIDDIIGDESTKGSDMPDLLRNKAIAAANKGATALVLYSTSGKDLGFDSLDTSARVPIPVFYLTQAASGRYCADESATLDIKLNADLADHRPSGTNVVGILKGSEAAPVLVRADLGDPEDVAALLEVARLSRSEAKGKNLVFLVYDGREGGLERFQAETAKSFPGAAETIVVDAGNAPDDNGLRTVKASIETLKQR